jgi:hypothetical protein
MTMNLLNNSFFDNNLLSYGLLLGSLSILGYSIYYAYSNILVSSSESKVLKTLSLKDNPNHDNMLRESLINKISINTNKDLSIPQVKTEELVETMSDYVETGVQTDIKMLYDYLQELLYNNATPVTSLGEMEPETFAELLRNDPQGPAYLEHIQTWVDNVPTIITSNPGSQSNKNNSLTQVLDSMKSNLNSPVEQLSNNQLVENSSTAIEFVNNNNNVVLSINSWNWMVDGTVPNPFIF